MTLRSRRAILAVAAAILGATFAGWIAPLDHALTALRFSFSERAPTGTIVLVDIDAKSIEAAGRWPWPRRIHADLVDALRALGAAEVAFDVDFSAPSNTQDDAAFAAALARADGTVILAALDQRSTARPGEAEVVHNRPIEPLARHAWVASLNVDPDSDGKLRHIRFADEHEGEVLPSLAAMLGGASGRVGEDFAIDFGIRADAIDRMSVIDVLRGDVARQRVAGRKVIVGASAVELRDFFTVPVYGSVSGSLAQALGAESVAQGRALTETGRLAAALGVVAISLIYFFLRKLCWTRLLGTIAIILLSVEAGALLAQRIWPIVPETGALDVALCGFALLTLLREIDFRRILILIAHNRTSNVQTVLDRVVEDNFAGVVVADEEGVVRAASRTAATILGTKGELVGAAMQAVLPAHLCEAIRAAIDAARRGDPLQAKRQQYWYRDREARQAVLEYVVTPSRLAGDPAPNGERLPDTFVAALTFVDVTREREAASRIAYLARFDTLTGLPNRNQFIEALEVALNRGASCAVVCFDIDRFKYINDTLGHDIGDRVVQAVAGRARRLMAPGDLVARFGGDDFAIICAGGNAGARALALAEDLIEHVGEPYEISGYRQVVALSFGIAVAESNGDEPLALLQRADTALAVAKANGGNCVACFDPSMAVGLRKRQNLEAELWEAFERGEFELYYQPQVDLADERVVGFEALLRWKHEKLGYVSPAEFIPIAEATGLILKLGAWVLEEACMVAATWPPSVGLAVNVSPVQLARDDYVRTVAKALARSGLPADRLVLEITESVLLQENRGIRATIDELLGLGASLALDDFGTGYSSLTYVHKFPIAKVKIDRSFVSDIATSQEAAAIVRAVAALARSLDIRLNAEGIETREQLELLRLLGCAEGQGYLFGKPAPKEVASELIASQMRPAFAERAAS